MKQTILVLESKAKELRAILEASLPGVHIATDASDDAIVHRSEIWLGEPDQFAALLAKGARPKWIQSSWAGYQPLLADGLPRDYRLSRAIGIFGQPIAEYLLAYLLAHEQGFVRRMVAQEQRRWEPQWPDNLSGRRALIVGAGDIGQDVARFLGPFGVILTAVVSRPRSIEGFEKVFGIDGLTKAVANADYVINIMPDTPSTRGVFNRQVFEAMAPHALFLNVGRGTAVVDEDLIQALSRGQLAGAVLDVFSSEPLPPEHPFWGTPGVTLTPHVAGNLIPRLLCDLFLENLRRLQAGEKLKGEVDFSDEY